MPDPHPHAEPTSTAEALTLLRGPGGAEALAAAAALTDEDPLRAATRLRAHGFAPPLATAALTQARLRARAKAKFGADAAHMFFTRAGVEQATRHVVATHRAARLARAGVRRLADLTCGIGADTVAAARAGIAVHAVDADCHTAAVAAANTTALELSSLVRVECARAEDVDLTGADAVFCDPSRRQAGSGRRVFHPDAFTPAWSFVRSLPQRVPRTVLKLAPGLPHELIPPGAEAQWVCVDGDLVEAAVWCGPLATVPRRATILRGEPPAEPGGVPQRWREEHLTGSGQRPAPVGPVGAYLFDPDPAVVRAYLVAELADQLDAHLADPHIAYLYSDRPRSTPYARCLQVLQRLPFSLKRLRAALRAAHVGRVEILKRGSALDPDRLRRDLRLSGDTAATVVLTRVAGAPTALICRPVA